jgi:hypothetical protein
VVLGKLLGRDRPVAVSIDLLKHLLRRGGGLTPGTTIVRAVFVLARLGVPNRNYRDRRRGNRRDQQLSY